MNNWLEKDQSLLWHPYSSLQPEHKPLMIESAKGVYLYTPDGRKIVDAISSWWVNIHGHANEYIADAIAVQARKLEHVIFAGFTHEQAITLAERLVHILPGDQKKIYYSDNGSTAVEVALKMSIQYWYNKGIHKRKIVALKGAFHGDTFGAMAVGEKGLFTQPFEPFLFEVEFLDFPTADNSEEVITTFRELCSTGEIAAFIYEPLVQGAAGMRMYSENILSSLLEIAAANEVIAIADEVMTGFGRTGRLFASDYCVPKPDIICLSKGLTGGTLPLGVTACNTRVMEAFDTPDALKTFYHGHSFTANPITCACANASLDLLLKEDCLNSIQLINSCHKDFAERVSKHTEVKSVNVRGTILAIELNTTENTHYLNSLRSKIYNYFLSRDILLRPLGNVLYVLPPYITKEEELRSVYQSIADFLDELKK